MSQHGLLVSFAITAAYGMIGALAGWFSGPPIHRWMPWPTVVFVASAAAAVGVAFAFFSNLDMMAFFVLGGLAMAVAGWGVAKQVAPDS